MPTGWVWSDRFLEPGELRSEGQDLWGPERLRLIADAASAADLGLVRLTPRSATVEEILSVHTDEYVRKVADYSSGAAQRGDDYRFVDADTAIASNTSRLSRLGGGVGADGARRRPMDGTVSNAVVLARPGDHHAYPSRGEGFCIFNHTAIGARYAQASHGVERVLIVNWDVHHGNGTQAIFYSDPSVFVLSIHSYGSIYPRSGHESERGAGPGRGATLNVPIQARTRDRRYVDAFAKALRSIRFTPDVVLVVAGFDSHDDDPVGDLKLSDGVYTRLTKEVLDFAERTCSGRVVSVLAGGYNPNTIGGLVVSHVQALSLRGKPRDLARS